MKSNAAKQQNDNKFFALFKKNLGYATRKDIIDKGFNYRYINKALSSGKIVKVKRGLYRFTDTPFIYNQGLVEVSKAIPEGVICLLSALSFYELTTFNPSTISVAINRKSRPPKINYPPIDLYYFSKRLHELGAININIENYSVRIYDMEKTICDCFRYRNKLGIDTAKEGLSEYLKLKNRDLEKLLSYAEVCRVRPIVETWLQAMV